MTQERPEEEFAFAVVGRVLAVTVERYDICGRQGAVDAILHYLEGRTAALEVTSVGPDAEAGIINYLGKRGYYKNIVGVTRKWLIHIPRNFHPADMRKIERVLPQCEAAGAKSLVEMTGLGREVEDLLGQGVSADIILSAASETDPAPSRVYFMLPAIGGFPGPGMVTLPDELTQVLRIPQVQKRIRKLAVTGLNERHLFLIVRPSAFSFPIYDGLSFGGPLPTEAPSLPDDLSQVWLLTGVKEGGVVRGISGRGWYRDHPYDEPGV